MDRKGTIGLVFIVLLFAGWNFYYLRKTQEAAAAQQQAEAAAAAIEAANPKPAPTEPAAPAAPSAAAPGSSPEATPAAMVTTGVEEKVETLATPSAQYAFSNLGGGIQRATLLEHLGLKDQKIVLNEFGTIPIGAMSETPGVSTNEPFNATVEPGGGAIVFERTTPRQIQVTKRFTLPKFTELSGKERLREEYLVDLSISFTNRGTQPVEQPLYYVHTGSAAPLHQADQPIYTGFNYFYDGNNKFVDVNWFTGGGFWMFKSPARESYPEKPETLTDLQWAGVTNQYFTTLCTPLADERALLADQAKQRGVMVWARKFDVTDAAWQKAGHATDDVGLRLAVDGAIGMAGFTLQPGETVTRNFQIYSGPREYRRLRELGHFEAEIMDFGIFSIVSKTLLNSMNTFKRFLGNYAWAIVLLTIIIKLLMWPLQNKATASMKKMQALQPKMTELREKYKDNPQMMNTEVMKLYKQYGVNPFGGCLPMLIQIPIFFGFYNMLGKAVELRNSSFLWVDDLSQPDTIFYLGGIPVNVLPLLMAGTMVWSMALQPKSGDAVQQRVMMFVPLIFIFFCYNFASALALYWTVQNIFSVVQLYVTRQQTSPTLEKVAPPKAKR